MRSGMEEADRRSVLVHRVSPGSGVTMLTRDERSRWAQWGADSQLEVSLYVRPTASGGTGAAWLSPTGHPLAGQVHGVSHLGAAVDQVRPPPSPDSEVSWSPTPGSRPSRS